MNRNGSYMKYSNLPLMALGLRLAIRLLDFENSLKMIGKDEFVLLIAMNAYGIMGNILV